MTPSAQKDRSGCVTLRVVPKEQQIHDPLTPFAGCSDAASLSCAIQSLCAEKGIVSRVDICMLEKAGKRQALCFVRTDSAVQEQKLAGTPGLTRFGNEMLFVVDLP